MRSLFLTLSLVLLYSQSGFSSDVKNKKELLNIASGGATLHSPIGRQSIEEQPLTFKWSMNNSSAETISLKIYKIDSDDSLKNEQITSLDFKAQVNTIKLAQVTLSEGSYFWELHSFNSSNPLPLTTDKAYFNIKTTPILNLRTRRIFASFASGRGDYVSEDPNYLLSFDTTPTVFGAGYAGGSKKSIYEFTYSFTDFIVRGGIKKSQSFKANYSWRLMGQTPYSFELFIGPQIRALTFPLVNSPDGTNIRSENVTAFTAGLAINLHRQLNEQASLFMSAFIDTAVDSSESEMSYELKMGAFYKLTGPVGVGADLTQRSDQVSKVQSAGLTKGTNEYLALSGKIIYIF